MIILLIIISKNIYYQIFAVIKITFDKLNSNIESTKRRPHKSSDEQIVVCMPYGVKNRIFSLIELEYRINHLYKITSINLFSRLI